MLARSPSHSPEGRDLDFAAAKAVQSIGSHTVASFFTRLMAVAAGEIPVSAEISPSPLMSGLLLHSPTLPSQDGEVSGGVLPAAQHAAVSPAVQRSPAADGGAATTSSSSSSSSLSSSAAASAQHATSCGGAAGTAPGTSVPNTASPSAASAESAAAATAARHVSAEQEEILYIQRLCQMAAAQLEGEKKRVKTELKAFDEDFFRRHRRTPSKAEKEAIRPKYELYNDIKLLLANAANGEKGSNGGAGGTAQAQHVVVESPISLEKKLLQRRLRRFESQFEAREGRKVKYHKDIASVRATYQRYKNLKRILQSE